MIPATLTVSNEYFNFLSPKASRIFVYDIIHALSNVCRFGGHCRTFYSVAQHSVMVSRIDPKERGEGVLFHDAAEAFIGDCQSPLKQLLPDYQEIEKRVEAAIFPKLNIEFPLHESIKHADLVMLATERRDLMPANDDVWEIIEDIEPLPEKIEPLSPEAARFQFGNRYLEINRERKNETR